MSAAQRDRLRSADQDARMLEYVKDEERKMGRAELSFVGETTLINDGHVDRAWWCPPKISEDSFNARSARHRLGMLYALEFVTYLRQNRPGGFDPNDSLQEIVEAMTGQELGEMERSFFRTIACEISGWETTIAHAGKNAEFYAYYRDEVAPRPGAAQADAAVEVYRRWLKADRNVQAVMSEMRGLEGDVADEQEKRLSQACDDRGLIEEQLLKARASTAAGILAKAEVFKATKADFKVTIDGDDNVENRIALSMCDDLFRMFGQLVPKAR